MSDLIAGELTEIQKTRCVSSVVSNMIANGQFVKLDVLFEIFDPNMPIEIAEEILGITHGFESNLPSRQAFLENTKERV